VSAPQSKAVGASSTSVSWVPSQPKLPFAPVPRLSASQGATMRSTTKNLLDDDPMAFFRGPTSSSPPSTATPSIHDFSSSPNLKRVPGPVVAPDPKRQKQMDATSFRQNVALASMSDRPQPRSSTATLTTIASVTANPTGTCQICRRTPFHEFKRCPVLTDPSQIKDAIKRLQTTAGGSMLTVHNLKNHLIDHYPDHAQSFGLVVPDPATKAAQARIDISDDDD